MLFGVVVMYNTAKVHTIFYSPNKFTLFFKKNQEA